MPFGLSVGEIVGLVREARGLEGAAGRIAISGPGAQELAMALAEGGDATAIQVDGDPIVASVAIRLFASEPSETEGELLRRISRAGTPLVVVRHGFTSRIPHVLAGDVLESDGSPSVAEVAAAIARIAPEKAPALAARLPALRPAVERRLVGVTAITNAAIAAAPWSKVAQLPVLALAQSRMLLLLGISRGEVLPRDPQQLAAVAGPVLAGSLGLGLVARTLVRRLPRRGPLVRAAVAFAGTRALGAARTRL